MRISDWSSDVCSSDLDAQPVGEPLAGQPADDIALFHQPLIGLLGGHIAFEQHQHEIGLARHHAQAGIAELAALGAEPRAPLAVEIVSASCRERVCKYV